jgi:hypothetical protein
VCQKFGNF